ncbi:MAG: alkane 1-monooxygenase [Gammaproteobacteria bacterium]|nr:alkane 1-monooxygenase [Gammaproteobacteria bacterium]MBM4230162.1 alkane 1-monooxygenase [Gammaproteobacteria bacterium]
MIKKIGYLAPILVALLPTVGFIIGQETGNWLITVSLTPFVLFVVVPILDGLIGRDPSNPSAAVSAGLSKERYYRLLPMLCLPAYVATLLIGAWVVANEPMSPLLMLGWIISIGLAGGIVAITPAHELIHKPNKIEPLIGGTLLAMVSYGTFKIEHIAGHHIDVATPRDGTTARIDQTVFSFIFRSMTRNPGRALDLERASCTQCGKIWRWYSSESVGWIAASVGFCIICMLIVNAASLHPPWVGGAYFLGQSVVAVALLEIVNYIEHYGLTRRELHSADGPVRYERVNHLHSWNADFAVTNALLFQLQRHSDHHAFGFRRYQVLRHHPDSPQLPAGYPTMVLVALLPPLWFHIMNPRVPRYDQHQSVICVGSV